MKLFFSGSPLWHLVVQSDGVTIAVLLFLLIMSIVGWAIFFCKVGLLKMKQRHLQTTIAELSNAQSIDDCLAVAQRHKGTLPGYFLHKNASYIKSLVAKLPESRKLDAYERDRIASYSNQTIDVVMVYEESYLSFLSTSIAISPLLGLFGTVWGLIHSFVSISEKQVADITVVAPGIAQALITTLAGLLVAIPALVLFNYLLNQIRYIEQQLLILVDKMTVIVEGTL